VTAAFVASLVPVRAALHVSARRDGERAVADADAATAAAQAVATAEAEQILAEARSAGAADAAAFAATERARADRRAREALLAAQREEYDGLRDAARTAASALRLDPGWPRLRARLLAAARALLGPDAVIGDATGGGVAGRVPGRRLDLSLAVLADRALASVAQSIMDDKP
jgi:hypothetical protein